MRYCAAVGCSNGSRTEANRLYVKEKSVTFHGFPLNDKPRLKVWLDLIGRKNFTPTTNSSLCSEHFDPEAFTFLPFTHYRLLKKDAVPSIFKHLEPSITEPENPLRPFTQLKLYDTFDSWNEFHVAVKSYMDRTKQPLEMASIEKVVTHNKDCKYPFPISMVYYYQSYRCKYNKVLKPKGVSMKVWFKSKDGCKAEVRGCLHTSNQTKVVVTVMNEEHNHELGVPGSDHDDPEDFKNPDVRLRADPRDPDDLLRAALLAVDSKSTSIYGAARQYGISYNTLKLRVQRRPLKSPLTRQEEGVLCDWMIGMARAGLHLTRREVSLSVKKCLDYERRTTKLTNNLPGHQWYSNFKVRHPEIKDLVPATEVSDESFPKQQPPLSLSQRQLDLDRLLLATEESVMEQSSSSVPLFLRRYKENCVLEPPKYYPEWKTLYEKVRSECDRVEAQSSCHLCLRDTLDHRLLKRTPFPQGCGGNRPEAGTGVEKDKGIEESEVTITTVVTDSSEVKHARKRKAPESKGEVNEDGIQLKIDNGRMMRFLTSFKQMNSPSVGF